MWQVCPLWLCALQKNYYISSFPLIDLFLFKSHESSLTFTENPKSLCQAALMNGLPPLKLVQNCWTVSFDSELDDLYRKHYLWLQWHITAKVRQISESILMYWKISNSSVVYVTLLLRKLSWGLQISSHIMFALRFAGSGRWTYRYCWTASSVLVYIQNW